MIVIAAKVSVRKILACVLAAGTVLTGAAVFLPADAQPAAAASENMRLDVKLRTNEQRVALLRDCGWEVIEEPRGEREVQIPEEFDEVYQSYNQIQLEQGLDLTPCRGRRATLYTYEITNHPSGEQGVTANLLVRRGKLIAADVSSPQADGFVHGLREHPSEPQDTPLTGRRQNAQLLEICAIQRKRVRHISVCIEHFRGIALFLYFPIVQNAKKRYTIFSIRLAGETKCRRCDWTSCSVT